MTLEQENEWRSAIKHCGARLKLLGETIGAPSEYIGHHNFILAFKRGVIMGMNPRLSHGWRWYHGEETHRAFERGWCVGRHRLAAFFREDDRRP